MYPVPTEDEMFIDFDLRLPGSPGIKVDIVNINGANVASFRQIGSLGKNRMQMDIKHLLPGIYLLQISSDEAGLLYTGKIIKSE